MNFKIDQITNDSYIFKIVSVSNLLSLIGSFIGSLLVFILFIFINLYLIKVNAIDYGLIFISIVFLYISISLFNTFFWLKSGFELVEIRLKENRIFFSRYGLWKFDKFNFEIGKNLTIRYLEENERFFDRVQSAYGYTGGGILIEDSNKKMHFGLSLSNIELQKLVNEINAKIPLS